MDEKKTRQGGISMCAWIVAHSDALCNPASCTRISRIQIRRATGCTEAILVGSSKHKTLIVLT
jgi:hypothetical protein